jgi:sulfur relay (sulfurtransferase) complex TusBCD TusD component (DsrE family)
MFSFRARVAASLVVVLAVVTGAGAESATQASSTALNAGEDSVIFFTADGLRQDSAQFYASNKAMPTIAKLLKLGAKAGES